MTLYLDTSSLVKLYVDEHDSEDVARLVSDAVVVATSVVAYAEARAAFARLRRERRMTSSSSKAVIARFETDWSRLLTIGLTEPVALSAGALADRLALRGFDAIHLASFEALLALTDDEDVRFSSADGRLVKAARKLD